MIAMQRHPLEVTLGTNQQLDQTEEDAVRLVSAKVILVSGRRALSPNHMGRSCHSAYRLANTPHDRPYAHTRTARQGLPYCASAEVALSRHSEHVMWHIPFALGKRPKMGRLNAVAREWGKGGTIDYGFTHPAQHAMASRCLIWKLYRLQAQFCDFSRSWAWYGPVPLHEGIPNE